MQIYTHEITFTQSCIKESAEKFNPDNKYTLLEKYGTVKALFDEVQAESETTNVLCWGSLTESAILVNYCMNIGRDDLLKKFRFIGYWTSSNWHPEDVANCR